MIRMDEMQFLGYAVTAIITLGAFFAVIQKMTQPINDLKVVIQELRDCISTLKTDNDTQNKRIDKQGEDIKNLNTRVDKLETKVSIYHHDDN